MPRVDVGLTNRSQLEAIRDWGNHPAWLEFHKRYDPLVRRCLAHLRLDHATTDEICQETWVQVANRMRSFVYDPAGSFRGWLWTVTHHEAMKFLARSARERMFSLDERDDEAVSGFSRSWEGEAPSEPAETTAHEEVRPPEIVQGDFSGQEPFRSAATVPGEAEHADGGDDEGSRALAALLRDAGEIQAAVRRAVKPHTWEAFWLVGVAFWTVDAAASHLQISPASVIKAKGRVTKMLQREACRRGLKTRNS
jgi:RNA polymerase sigma factor (sigma-70 family)